MKGELLLVVALILVGMAFAVCTSLLVNKVQPPTPKSGDMIGAAKYQYLNGR